MNKIFTTLSVFILIFCSCQNRQVKKRSNEKDSVSVINPIDSSARPENEQTDTLWSKYEEERLKSKMRCDSIISTLSNLVQLDTLLENITCQQNVKVLAELTEEQNGSTYTYSGGGYTFKIKLKLSKDFDLFPADENAENTVFYDGKKRIAFRDCKVTCYGGKNYFCSNFELNSYNRFFDPKIIEVCGKKFLYSDVSFPCNGMGCGQKLTMIYDLKEKKPTFVSSFRLYFNDFLLSDFNGDNVPDLLVVAQSNECFTNSDDFEYRIKLLAYSYDKGAFKPSGNVYDLYAVQSGQLICSIKKDHWFKNQNNYKNRKVK